jgi:hypothetical protein
MGCGTSKLKGDPFDSINSSTYPPVPRDKDKIERYRESKPLIYNADIPKTAKETPAAKKMKLPALPRQSSEEDKLASSGITSVPQQNPATHSSSSGTHVPQKEALHNSSNKLSTLRQRWKERRGVPEPRDPVTGRGLHTGLTPEEIKKLVESTRGAGGFGFGSGGFGESYMGARYIANEPLMAARVRPEELEALKNWQNQSQMQGRAHAEKVRGQKSQ